MTITVTNSTPNITVNNSTNTVTVTEPTQTITVVTNVSKNDIGLGNVDNTSDANKPVSTATQTALNLKANETEITVINGTLGTKANSANPNLSGTLTLGDAFVITGSTDWTNRPSRPTFQGGSGTQTGIRIVPPSTATNNIASISANTTADVANTDFISFNARNSANGLRILTGTYTNNVLGNTTQDVIFLNNTTTTATINHSGTPTNTTDLTTKSYVDSKVPTTTDSLTEGTTNLYYTNGRVQSYLTANGYAKTNDITTAVNAVIGAAPTALNTLKELADALGDDANFASTVTTSLAAKANTSSLATVATSGSYTDLANKPTLFSGSYTDLTNKPSIPAVPTAVSSFTNDANYITTAGARSAISVTGSLAYNSTTGVISYTAPTLATVATTGSYSDLTNKPTLFSGSYVDLTNKPALATVATSGSYTDLLNKPTIPTVPTAVSSFTNDSGYVTSAGARSAISVTGSLAYNSTTGVISYTAPTLATVATTGSYTDLTNKPTIPTVPTTISSFTNDSGYVTASGAKSAISGGTGISYNSSTGVISTSQDISTSASPTFATVTANLANAKYILGQTYITRNTSWTPPANSLTSLDGNNGISISSSSGTYGYSPQVSINYYSGDTTAGTNASAGLITRGASGTNASPSAAATNQVLGTWNIDGYATSGWASSIATTGSGAGTSSIQPLQVQAYAVSAFTDSAGTVTNAPVGFRVRGFAASSSLSTSNRVNFIDHQAATATYKTNTFNIQGVSASTNLLSVSTANTNIITTGGTIAVRQDAVNTMQPSMLIRHQRTDTTGSNDGDGVDFRLQTGGTTTTDSIARVGVTYKSTGVHQTAISVSTDSFATNNDIVYRATRDLTEIRVNSTASAGSSATVLAIDKSKAAFTVPVGLAVYTASALRAITGAAGWTASVSDNNGKIAYWDTTNNRWAYISSDAAV